MTLLFIMLTAFVAGALLWKIVLMTLDAEDRGRTDLIAAPERSREPERTLTGR